MTIRCVLLLGAVTTWCFCTGQPHNIDRMPPLGVEATSTKQNLTSPFYPFPQTGASLPFFADIDFDRERLQGNLSELDILIRPQGVRDSQVPMGITGFNYRVQEAKYVDEGQTREMDEEWMIYTNYMYRRTTIYLQLLVLNIEESNDCSNAGLRIYTGYRHPELLANLCGSSGNFSAKTDSIVWVEFTSGDLSPGQGFVLQYWDIKENESDLDMEYSQSWGAAVIITCVVVVIALILTTIIICVCYRKTNSLRGPNSKGPYKIDKPTKFDPVECESAEDNMKKGSVKQ